MLFAEAAASVQGDPWTFGALVFSLATAGLTLSFSLGFNLSTLRHQAREHKELEARVTKDEDQTKEEIHRIFEKLDKLASAPPHTCPYVGTLAELGATAKLHGAKISDLEEAIRRIEHENALKA